eukprot:15458431-Alexandrium_andersonii.AAC.1
MLGDKLELLTYSERFLCVNCRLGLEEDRALAQEATPDAPVGVAVGALVPENSGEGEPLGHQQLDAALAASS